MRIAELVSKRPQRLDDGPAVAEDLLEHLFAVIVGRQLKRLRKLAVERWQVVLIRSYYVEVVEQPSADVLKQGASERDGPGGVVAAPV